MAALAAVALGAGMLAASAAASEGVRLDLGTVKVDGELGPGGTYRLPTIGVSNPGTQRTTYAMAISAIAGGGGRDVEASWVEFAPRTFELDPGATQAVTVHLHLPPDAASADYVGLMRADVAADNVTGVGVGAAAGAVLRFTVRPASGLDGWSRALGGWLDQATPWPQLVIVVLGALVALRLVRRRWTVRLERRP